MVNASFEEGLTTPATAMSRISLPSPESEDEWIAAWKEVRDSGILPAFGSDLSDDEALRREFLEGARMLGLIGRTKTLKPQQLRLADTLNAGHTYTGVLLPRRSAKTTTILAWLLGRCALRDGYRAAYTVATSGKRARDRFLQDIVPPLERLYPDKDSRPFRIRKSNGQERIDWDNGSSLVILKPAGEAVRGDTLDVLVVDEGGEADPETGEDLMGGVLPTFDTAVDPQLVIAGTAAKYRTGNLLWDELAAGRDPRNGHGILEYSAGEFVSADDLNDWDTVAELVLAAHPGIGTLTTLDRIKDNWGRLKRDQFSAEYLGIFGLVGVGGGLLDIEQWKAAGTDDPLPAPPDNFTLVVAAHPDQISATIAAVWREDGTACFLVLEHRPGVQWLAERAVELARHYSVPIVHDSRGVVMVEVEAMHRFKPRPRLYPQTTRNITTAAGLLVKEVAEGNVRHYNQPVLTAAAEAVTKRKIGGTWGLGRTSELDDIITIEAVSMGLRAYDDTPQRINLGIITAD